MRANKDWAGIIKTRFKPVLGLDPQHAPVIESLRFQDEDNSIKGGALLGFSGLIIASSLVQLSAPEGSVIYVAPDSFWLPFAKWGLVLLVCSSFFALFSITWGRARYADEAMQALVQFADLIRRKKAQRLLASLLCLLGSSAALSCLIGTILGWTF